MGRKIQMISHNSKKIDKKMRKKKVRKLENGYENLCFFLVITGLGYIPTDIFAILPNGRKLRLRR